MAFDGAFLHKIIDELQSVVDCHIEKIYQPSRDEIVFSVRKKGFVKRLFITVKPGCSRIQFTENKLPNPSVPPNFCMLLRKYISAARVVSVSQPGFERIAEIGLSATNELGDIVEYKLVCELIGNMSNIILLNSDGKILDALKHSDVETATRYLLPGAVYEYPKSFKKDNLLSCDLKKIKEKIESNEKGLYSGAIENLDGFSPLICREIEFLAGRSNLSEALCFVKSQINGGSPTLIKDSNGTPLDYSFFRISQYTEKYKSENFSTYSDLLDAFYTAKENSQRIVTAAHDIERLVKNLRARTLKKTAIREKELENSKDREKLRIFGELLKANLYNIPQGSSFAEVANYYDENMATVRIPLNPALSPSKNADKYFKDWKKSYTAEQTLKELIIKDKEELLYLDTVLDSISRAETIAQINEIRLELTEAGYIKSSQNKRPKTVKYEFKEELSKEGYRIIIGKNNIQNDYITLKIASKLDLWFHTKNIPGSHVIVMCDGNEVSEETVLRAATLAATNSKAAYSSNVPVDYTRIKYVKKPADAKPGMVTYTTNKTVFVTPEKSE